MTELSIVQYINNLGQGTFIDKITVFISYIPFLIGLWLVLSLLSIFLDKQKGKYVFLAVVMAIALHFIISEGLLKHAILTFFDPKLRPWLVDEAIKPLGQQFSDSSFPSSHMASTLAVLTVFMSFYKRSYVYILAILFAILMAFARLHNGMHFPTDVLAGTTLGIVYGLSAHAIASKILKSRSSSNQTSPKLVTNDLDTNS